MNIQILLSIFCCAFVGRSCCHGSQTDDLTEDKKFVAHVRSVFEWFSKNSHKLAILSQIQKSPILKKILEIDSNIDLNAETEFIRQVFHESQHSENMLSDPASSETQKDVASEIKAAKQTFLQAQNVPLVQYQLARTCLELRSANPSLPSGTYYIDPDGFNSGDQAVPVFCDMTTGKTSIRHHQEDEIKIANCSSPGCFSVNVTYDATMRQIAALTELSSNCVQSIQYKCNYAPFEVAGTNYAWWNDRNGQMHYEWTGDTDQRICECAISKSCFHKAFPCNCDAAAPLDLVDRGYLSNKNVLPVTRLNFGLSAQNYSRAHFSLGPLECTGRTEPPGRPETCHDLWRMGQTFSGYYNLRASGGISMVFCDMSKLPTDPGFETVVGNVDVKRRNVAFYATRHTNFNGQHAVILYEDVHLNDGDSLNPSTGIFKVPVDGIYSFSFTANFLHSSTTSYNYAILKVNGITKGITLHNVSGKRISCSMSVVLNLKTADRVYVVLNPEPVANEGILDNYNHYTQFTGILIREIMN